MLVGLIVLWVMEYAEQILSTWALVSGQRAWIVLVLGCELSKAFMQKAITIKQVNIPIIKPWEIILS